MFIKQGDDKPIMKVFSSEEEVKEQLKWKKLEQDKKEGDSVPKSDKK